MVLLQLRGTGIYQIKSYFSFLPINFSIHHIWASGAEHHGVPSHQGDRDSAEELASGLPVVTPLLSSKGLAQLPDLPKCHTVEASQSLDGDGKEKQTLCPASLSREKSTFTILSVHHVAQNVTNIV